MLAARATRPGAIWLLAAFVALCVMAAPAGAESSGQRADALLGQMTNDEKLDLIDPGAGTPRLGIPSINPADGPNGIGEGAEGVTAFPNAVNIGASWDPRLARAYGAALGAEAAATGHNLLFAPTVNIVRDPRWGRAAETFGEDPFLSSSLVAPEIRGIQSRRVMADVKHYALNNQEYGRFGAPLLAAAVDVEASPRTLREIYLPAFEAAVGPGGAASVMCAYNQIGGEYACQNEELLSILKDRFPGFVEPDSTLAVRNVIAGFNAGVDQFALGSLPGNERQTIASALAGGQISQERVDDAARRILVGMIKAGAIDPVVAEGPAGTKAHRRLATRISTEATVLLRNRGNALPLGNRDRSIAVIGHDAGDGTQIEEGGSPAVLPGRDPITPLQGMRRRAPRGTKISYAKGTSGVVPLPLVPPRVLTPSSGPGPGLYGEFFTDRAPTFSGLSATTRVDPTIDFKTTGSGGPSVLQPIPGTSAGSVRYSGTLTPPETGTYRFSLTAAGSMKLRIAGEDVISGDAEFVQGGEGGFPGAPPVSFQGTAHLTAGQPVPIEVEYATNSSIGGAELHLGWQLPAKIASLQKRAVKAARASDVAVVFANDLTAEGMDRPDLALPGDQDDLIEKVAAANPRTIVVLHTASAVTMPWRKQVRAIVEAWYPGQQSGTAIAKTLWGDVDPSGRLPVTFPNSDSQGPAAGPHRYPILSYDEGLEVGYRWYDANGRRPLYPFGFGLSYANLHLGKGKIDATKHGWRVRVPVANRSARKGTGVVQAYVGFPSSAGEPPQQLEGFDKVVVGPRRTKPARIEIDRSDLRIWDEAKQAYVSPRGRYTIGIGTSSRDIEQRFAIKR